MYGLYLFETKLVQSIQYKKSEEQQLQNNLLNTRNWVHYDCKYTTKRTQNLKRFIAFVPFFYLLLENNVNMFNFLLSPILSMCYAHLANKADSVIPTCMNILLYVF